MNNTHNRVLQSNPIFSCRKDAGNANLEESLHRASFGLALMDILKSCLPVQYIKNLITRFKSWFSLMFYAKGSRVSKTLL